MVLLILAAAAVITGIVLYKKKKSKVALTVALSVLLFALLSALFFFVISWFLDFTAELIFFGVYALYVAVSILAYIVDGIKAKKEGRPRSCPVTLCFTVAVVFIVIPVLILIYAEAGILIYGWEICP